VAGGRIAYATQRAAVPWWSFTKTVIAAAILALARDGELVLDVPFAGREFSLRQALAHRAGIPCYSGLAAYRSAVDGGHQPWSEDELLRRTGADRALHAPGVAFNYSNVGYLLLRRIIERRCELPLGEALAKLVLAPLDIEGVALLEDKPKPGDTIAGLRGFYHPGWVYHGLLAGPPASAALLLDRLLQTDFLPEELRRAMAAGISVGEAMEGRPFQRPAYGLGLMVDAVERPVLGHTGGGPDSTIAVYWSARTGRAAAVFGAGEQTGAVESRAFALIDEDEEDRPL